MTFSTLGAVCGTCQSALIPSSRATDGLATEYCGTCQVESLTTLRGTKAYDQRARLEAELLHEVQRDSRPADPKFQHGQKMRALRV